MCQHGDSTKTLIEELICGLYPAIQYQLILISAYNNQNDIEETTYDLLKELRKEFEWLVSYEIRVVFPSVLKVFDHANRNKAKLPNITDMQILTTNKEQKLIQLSDILSSEFPVTIIKEEGKAIHRLIELIKNDFVTQKTKWNNMIRERLQGCACFRQAANIINITKAGMP